MSEGSSGEAPAADVMVSTWFVRDRNALLARASFSNLYLEYYLHQGQHGYQHTPAHDLLIKDAIAALTLHCASRPWNESWAWTVHWHEPLLNLFVTGDNPQGTVVGQLFEENVKDDGRNLFIAVVARQNREPRKSATDFTGMDLFAIVEQFYVQSEQRPARYFRCGDEEIALITAQPDCDFEWLEGLEADAVRDLGEVEILGALEERAYRWECGCTEERMFAVLMPLMRDDPDALFLGEPALRMSCPRCGARYRITREALEAYTAAQRGAG
jgi:molecular chaperone Hsp33